ncbi:transglutaminase family protein [Granulicella sp. WH15]|uniref:transglutaminase-like domain-containing protein n=1 Tax=Granulicella sp. WH15 TaxID=2602070 RepID=UPI0031F61E32
MRRRDDPLMVLHDLNEKLYKYFDYVPKSTKVDSPIDVALASKKGVCQDFAHVMIRCALAPEDSCRYVSAIFTTASPIPAPLPASSAPRPTAPPPRLPTPGWRC